MFGTFSPWKANNTQIAAVSLVNTFESDRLNTVCRSTQYFKCGKWVSHSYLKCTGNQCSRNKSDVICSLLRVHVPRSLVLFCTLCWLFVRDTGILNNNALPYFSREMIRAWTKVVLVSSFMYLRISSIFLQMGRIYITAFSLKPRILRFLHVFLEWKGNEFGPILI